MFGAMLVFALLMGSAVQAVEEFSVEGTVNAVNFKEQKLNVTCAVAEELSGETTRDFVVDDPGILEEVRVGKKIKLTLSRQSDGVLVITDVEEVIAQTQKTKPLLKKK